MRGFLPLSWLHAWKNTDCPTINYKNTIHHNEIVIFCGTIIVLYHTGSRLRLINRILLLNWGSSTEYQKTKVDSACWHSWSKETQRSHVEKLRDCDLTFSDQFLKSKNDGRKPGFLNRKRYRAPTTVFVDRVDKQQEEGSQDLRLKSVRSLERQTWKALGSSSREKIRSSDPNEKRPRYLSYIYERYVPKLVKKCQGKCRQKIE